MGDMPGRKGVSSINKKIPGLLILQKFKGAGSEKYILQGARNKPAYQVR